MQLLLRHLPTLLLLYWGLAAGAAIVALTPLPFAEGFRCGPSPQPAAPQPPAATHPRSPAPPPTTPHHTTLPACTGTP